MSASPLPWPDRHWLTNLGPFAAHLRGYQQRQVGDVSQALQSGYRRILVQAPTGSGKSHQIVAIAEAAVLAGKRVLILVTRTRLVRQLHERLDAAGIRHGLIAAALKGGQDYSAAIQIASVDTLHRRAVVSGKMPLPLGDLLIFDEAHLSVADTRLGLLDRYPEAIRIGFSATPARKSGGGLGRAFDCLIQGPSIRELQRLGMLAPLRIFAAPLLTQDELDALPRDSANDFATDPLAELLARPKLIGDVVSNYLRIAAGKRTVCFAVHKAHGQALVQDFLRNGVAAELITDNDDEATRDAAIERLESGSTRVLVNCFLMSYGIDIPSLEAVILARPTRSLTMYLQMVGRVMRPAPGKEHGIVIDHGRVVETLGLPESDFEWSLKSGKNANSLAIKAQKLRTSHEAARTCQECSAVWLSSQDGNACPNCGWHWVPKGKDVRTAEADLEELTERENSVSPRDPVVVNFHRQAVGFYATKWPQRWNEKQNSGRWWAWQKCCEKFRFADPKIPVSFWSHIPETPGADVRGWLQSQLIRWYKRKKAA